MKALRLFRILEQLEELGRPDISKTQVSRASDRLIDSMGTALLPFISSYMTRGYFSTDELERLSALFLKSAQDQYFLGQDYADRKTDEPKPISQIDLHNMQSLATRAQQDFITSLAKQRTKAQHPDNTVMTAAAIAGLAAVSLGIRSLNHGTLSRAEMVEFVTRRDNRVCPICEAYDGKIYEVDEHGRAEGGPIIPDQTHPNCRCRYLIVP